MKLEQLVELVVEALEDVKAVDVRVVDVRGKTAITDVMVIASGTSDRHVKALADNVEGQNSRDWMLVDLNDVVIHVMLPEVRDFYNLEKLWSQDNEDALSAKGE
jgi:ribosome-associated protein